MVRAAFSGRRDLEVRVFAGVDSMGDGTRRDDDKGHEPADEVALSARLRRLGERLDQVRRKQPDEARVPSRSNADTSAFARGMRLSGELVGGVVVGFLFGWLLDRWLGTTPWGLIAFLLLGFAAGVLNVMRSAGVIKSGTGPDGSWK